MAIPFLSGLQIATGSHDEIVFTGTGGAKILAPVEMYLQASNDIYLMSHSSVNLTLGNNTATFAGTIGSGNINISDGTPVLTLTDTSSSATATLTLDGVNLTLQNNGTDGDFTIVGKDGSSYINLLAFDTSEGGNATFAGLGSFAGISSTISSATAGYFQTNTAIPANQIVHVRDNVATTSVSSAGGIKISSSPGNDVFLLKRWDHSGSASYFSLRNNSNTEHLAINMATGNATFSGNVSAPIFYDSNDTNYYVDPAGTSVTNTMQANYFRASTGSTSDPILRLTDAGVANYDVVFPDTNTYRLETSTSSTKTFRLYNAGSGSFKMQADEFVKTGGTSSQYLMADGSVSTGGNTFNGGTVANATTFSSNVTVNGTIFPNHTISFTYNPGSGGNTYFQTGTDSLAIKSTNSYSPATFFVDDGRVVHNYSTRSPIYYDKDNTAYYLDAANTGLSINVAGEYKAQIDHGNAGFIQTWRNTNTGGGAYVEHVIGQSGSSELRIGHAPNYGSSDWNASWVYAVGKPLFLKSSSNNVVIYAGGAGASDEVVIFDTNQNTTFKGDVEIGTSTHNGELTIRSLDSSSSTRTAKLKFNIAGTDTTGFTLHNNTSGIATNTLIYDVSGTEKVTIYGDGHIRTVNNVTAQIFRDQDNTAYYLDSSNTGTSLNVAGNGIFGGNVQADNIGLGSAASSFGTGVPTLFFKGTNSTNGRAGALYFKENDGSEVSALYSTNGADNYGTVLCAYQGDLKFAVGSLTGTKLTIGSNGTSSFGGDVVISSSGTGGSPALRINNLNHTTFNHGIEVYNGNLVQGESEIILVGKTGSTKNSGYLGYYWHADGSDDNFVTIGHYANNHLLRVYGSGTVLATGNMQAPIFYDSNDTAYYTNPASTSNLFALQVTDNLIMNTGQFYIGAPNTTTDDSYRLYETSGELILASRESGSWLTRFSISNGGAVYSHIDHRAPIFYDSNSTSYYANPASRSNFGSLNLNSGQVWDATTQGTAQASIHLIPGTSTDHAGGAITFGASDTSSGTTAQAGIYVRSDGSYGTRMYLSTTDSYASGSKTTIRLEAAGGLYVDRGHFYAPNFYDLNNTAYYVNPAGTSVMNDIEIDDYIYHKGDTDTYLYFETDSIKLRTGGTDRITLTNTEASFAENSRFSKEVTDGSGDAIKGYRLNKATSSSWTEGGTGAQTGWYGGNFGGSEVTTKWVDGPHGERTLAAETSGDTNNDYDGGYVKAIHNLDINKAHLSIVYIKRISSEGTGSVYHGTGAGTNQITNLSGTSNTNPYFHYPNLGSFPQDVWCVSIGVIQANNDDNTTAKTGSGDLQGIYRCDTGQKIMNSSNYWKMGSAGSTLNNGIRFFHYYSTNANAKLQWAKPGFYEINGDEPSLAEILTGGNRGLHTNGGDVTANRFYDWANTAYYVDPASTSILNDVEVVQLAVDDYIYHRGDTNTYMGFNAADSWKLHVGGGDRLVVSTSAFTSNLPIDLGSGGASIKKAAGNTNGNHAAIELYSSGTGDSGSAIAIQQQTSEGDSIIFADYEPHVEWGISTENSNNEIQFTAGASAGTMGSKTLYNNAGSARTAYKKMIFVLGTGVMDVGGSVRAPIFYDLNNTAYYTNPGGLSQMHTIDFDGAVSGSTTGAAQIGRNHAYDTLELKGYGAELMIGAQHTEININYRTCNNNTSGHTPTTWKWRAGASNNWSNHYFGAVTSNGILTATTDVRAPSFADSADTNYYLDPAGTGISLKTAGKIQHQGLQQTSGTNIDQIKEFSMTFQLAANTWTDTGIDGTDLVTGTYAMQVLVDDYGVAGEHYSEYYSAVISWFQTSTNSTNVDEIIVHRAGHAPNNGDVQFRTQRALGTDSHDLMLQVKHNKAYNAALNGTGSKQMKFYFRRLI